MYEQEDLLTFQQVLETPCIPRLKDLRITFCLSNHLLLERSLAT